MIIATGDERRMTSINLVKAVSVTLYFRFGRVRRGLESSGLGREKKGSVPRLRVRILT